MHKLCLKSSIDHILPREEFLIWHISPFAICTSFYFSPFSFMLHKFQFCEIILYFLNRTFGWCFAKPLCIKCPSPFYAQFFYPSRIVLCIQTLWSTFICFRYFIIQLDCEPFKIRCHILYYLYSLEHIM